MAITTIDIVKCECGHIGRIKRKENDTSYSSSNWQKIYIEDLKTSGKPISFEDSNENIFSDNKISCPECSLILNTKNIII